MSRVWPFFSTAAFGFPRVSGDEPLDAIKAAIDG